MNTPVTLEAPGSVQRDLSKRSTKTTSEAQSARTATREEIAQLAYAIWQQRGCPEGSAEQDWFDAERQCRSSR